MTEPGYYWSQLKAYILVKPILVTIFIWLPPLDGALFFFLIFAVDDTPSIDILKENK